MKKIKVQGLRDLSELIKSLYLNEPYYGYILAKMDRSLNESIETACVIPTQMKLMVNPKYVNKLNRATQLSLLRHEVLHIGLLHHERFQYLYEIMEQFDKEEDKDSDKYIEHAHKIHCINLATDCAINQIINPIHKDWIDLKKVEEFCGEKLEPKREAEYYFDKLINSEQFKKNVKNNQELQKLLDKLMKQHQNTLGKKSKGANKNIIRKVLQKARREQERCDRQQGRGAGDSILDSLPKYGKPVHKHIWERLIDQLFGEEPKADVDYYFGRPSRRINNSFWYSKHRLYQSKVYVGIDTSGSTMGDRDLFLGYINKGLQQNECIATLIQCDDGIQDIQKVKRIPKKGFKTKGNGGTDLRHILDYIEKNEKDLRNIRLILLTNGYTDWRKSPIKTSVVYTKEHAKIKPVYNWAVLEDGDDEGI